MVSLQVSIHFPNPNLHDTGFHCLLLCGVSLTMYCLAITPVWGHHIYGLVRLPPVWVSIPPVWVSTHEKQKKLHFKTFSK